MPKAAWLAPLLILLACSGSRAGDRSSGQDLSDQSVAASLTPGYCGAWETMDSISRATCQKSLLSNNQTDILASGDCVYSETQGPDSLHACLSAADSAAKSCPVLQSWVLRQADGAARVAEWHRCGPPGEVYQGDSIVWPVIALIIRRDSTLISPAIFSYSNREEPGASGLDTALAIDFDGDGSDELFLVNRVYGTGAIFESCAIAVIAGKLRCWTGPEFPEQEETLRAGEVLFKGWIEAGEGPSARYDPNAPRYVPRRSLWYTTPVYREGDANCCPTANASLWVEARPHNGRFETGFVLRSVEDSTGTVLRVDTLRH